MRDESLNAVEDTSRKSGCLGFLFPKKFAPAMDPPPLPPGYLITFPYGLRDDFLSAAELSFFLVLKGVLPPERALMAKVNLADLFFIRPPHLNKAAKNRIDRKHVDFLICNAKTMMPVLGVELDDASHQQKDRMERDDFVDRVFAAAGLPILHVKAARAYQPEVLAEAVRVKILGEVSREQ